MEKEIIVSSEVVVGDEQRPSEHHTTIVDPTTFARNYQLEALEKAIKENTIVFLETGSGKTLIAIMLLRFYAYLLRNPSDPTAIAVFLVPTVVLVSQQAKAVETHTDLKVGRYWGEMGVDFWDALTWHEQLHKYQVMVMTPKILLDALRHSFFKLDIIKLLIFDECHNARGRSDYACIMKEFYHPCLRSASGHLPRIFGMTASPVKSKGTGSSDVYGRDILLLEQLMNSKVFTVVNESVLAEFIPFSTPILKFYKHLDTPFSFLSLEDQLNSLKMKHMQHLKKLMLNDGVEDSATKKIDKLCSTYMYCATDLGIWLAYKAAELLSSSEHVNNFWGPKNDGMTDGVLRNFSQDVVQIFSAYIPSGSKWSVADDIGANLDAGMLSVKVNCLIESFTEYRMIKDLRCIVFVERVITAIVLQSLLSQTTVSNGWSTAYMAGKQSRLQTQSRKEQNNIIDAFRKGTVNIIVATQILEEGLDVQSCNLVIRFDPCTTVCSFIQSRGRARMIGSDYVLILRSGDDSTLSRVERYLVSGDIMREESLRHASLPCEPIESDLYDEEFYRVESTGAIVTLSSSIQLIYYYCSKLPSDGYFRPAPRFIINKESKLCTLYLPKSCPIQIVFVQGKEDVLKKLVCLEACRKLHEIGALTDNLLPELVVEEANAQHFGDMPDEDDQVNYFPGALVCHGTSNSQQLYHCYSIIMTQKFDYDLSFREIILVVKDALEYDNKDMDFELVLNRGSVTVNLAYCGTIHLTAEQVLQCKIFQITVLRVLIDRNMNKLEGAIARLKQKDGFAMIDYLLLPSTGYGRNDSVIDWECVRSPIFSSGLVDAKNCNCRYPAKNIHTKNSMVCRCLLVNSLVFTPHNGYVYCVSGILDEMNGNSKMQGDDWFTYKTHYRSRYGIKLLHDQEPLLSGRHLFTVQNWLQKRKYRNHTESSRALVELPPELCVIIMSPIPVGTVYSFSLVPSIMHRVETILLALNLKKMISYHSTQDTNVSTVKVVEAITTKRCQETFSLESLETLGDSFLKYAIGKQLFRSNAHHHEGLLSARKDKLICNKALCYLGCDRKLQGFIRHECFDPKKWTIPGDLSECSELEEIPLLTSGKIYGIGKRCMKGKVVADAVEALIGAYLISGGESAALHFLKWLGMEVDCVNEVPHENQLVHPERLVDVGKLEALLKGYSFRNPSLLVEALTHGSYQLSDVTNCYQRLEFLGDSVLDHLITIYLYKHYPGISPGLLTDLRSSSVNNDCYAFAAVKVGLHKHILHASSFLQKKIQLFVDSAEQLSLDSTFGWESATTVPKVLGDIIESLAGAILVDSGYCKEVVWECIRPLLEPLVTPETLRPHPIKELGEVCQKKSYKNSTYVTYENWQVSIKVAVEVDGILYEHTCTGTNKKTVKRLAYRGVLDKLKANIASL